jgi:hypothetical protein
VLALEHESSTAARAEVHAIDPAVTVRLDRREPGVPLDRPAIFELEDQLIVGALEALDRLERLGTLAQANAASLGQGGAIRR